MKWKVLFKMFVQVKCQKCGLMDNIEVSSLSDVENLKCEICHGDLVVIKQLNAKLESLSILKPETVKFDIEIDSESIAKKLSVPIEEIQQFPELAKAKLPENIRLRDKNPECTLKDAYCVNYNGKDCCLKLLHEKPKEGFKALFELFECELEKGETVEETQEGFEVNT
jgi:UDP-2,3-diacylglucosamine pyrophosphatase LpxH